MYRNRAFFAIGLASVGFGETFEETHDGLPSRKPFSPSPHPTSPRKILEEQSKKPKGGKYIGGFFSPLPRAKHVPMSPYQVLHAVEHGQGSTEC